MKFKKIEFQDKSAQRVYNNYIKSIEAAVKPLSKEDRLDILMEMNSHIFENVQRNTDASEMDVVLNAIDRLGTPEEVLKPLIADRMLDKATRTFNPLDVISALFYNIANGISYVIFAFLYLLLFTFIFLIGAKLVHPEVGMYFKDGSFQALGMSSGEGHEEVLGNWFIPFMIVLSVAWYFFITLLLKLKNSLLKSKTMKSVISTFVLLFVIQLGFSQNQNFAKLDSFFTVLEENDRFFGSVAVSKNDKIIYSKAIGYADLENKITNTNETKFRIGSISKTFTATLLMKAVEMNKITLDDTIDKFFPRIENANKITVRHLLNHRSGIKNFTDRAYISWYTEPITPSNLLDSIIVRGVDFEPNAKFSYSNSNYVLLTFILEKVFAQSFDKSLDQYIVKPLKLTNTSYGGKINPTQKEARSYKMKSEWTPDEETDMSIPLGAGGIVSTPADLCLFAKGLFGGKLLSTESLNQMKSLGEDNYGFALYETPFHELNGIGHGGSIDAFSSTLTYFEEENLSYAIICNGSNFGKNDVSIAVLSEVFGKPYELPSFDFVELTNEELDQYLGTYETDDLPMDMTISKEGKTLMLTATGQSSSVLMAEGDHKFSIMKYGVKIEFIPNEKKMHFEQNGMAFDFTLKESVKPIQSKSVSLKEPATINLEPYLGTYESDLLPMDLTISKKGNKLIGQGTGQPSFPLESDGQHTFSNDEIGLNITFIPSEKKMKFIQGSAVFEMALKQTSESVEPTKIDLTPYLGTYESDLLPMDLTITKKGNKLFGQGTGQPSFPLKPDGEHTFSNDEIGLKITFIPNEKKMNFIQGSASFEMTLKN